MRGKRQRGVPQAPIMPSIVFTAPLCVREIRDYMDEVKRGLVHTPAKRAEMKPKVEALEAAYMELGRYFADQYW